jgi:universal stress protein A
MKPIQRILCPVDFSDTSNHAVKYALGLAEPLGAEVHLLHVYQLPMYTMPDGALLAGPQTATRVMESAQQALNELAAGLGADPPLQKHLTEGVPHAEVERVANDIGADLIVMGTHGRTGLGHLLLGSVAERVVRTASVPVLTVRHPGARGS